MGIRTHRSWGVAFTIGWPICAAAYVFIMYAPSNPPPFGEIACAVLALLCSGGNCAYLYATKQIREALREAAQWREAAEEAKRVATDAIALNEQLALAIGEARADRDRALRTAGLGLIPRHRRHEA